MLLLTQAIRDSIDDCNELQYLIVDAISRLQRFIKDIAKTKKHIDPITHRNVISQAALYIGSCQTHRKDILKLKDELKRSGASQILLARADKVIRSAREFLRTHQTLFGALITSTDWQSPSYTHSIRSEAGRQTDTIYATINDYKRDQHWDALRYERAFIKEYVDNWVKFPINAYATSSGMAAFTTILNFLMMEKKDTRPVLIGASSYFENMTLVREAFGDRVVVIEETNTPAILDEIKEKQPSVVIFDSLTNSLNIKTPDLSVIIPYLVRHAHKETYLIVDNTCLSVELQPLKYIFGKRSRVRLIVLESLNKYHQFGADRVTGGIIWTYGTDTIGLFDYRVHLGTNIPDLVAASLPTPNKLFLLKRLMRHSRNAGSIASQLQSWIDTHPKSPFSGISYPSGNSMLFHGSYLTILWKEQCRSVPVYKRFVSSVTRIARKKHVSIAAGTSFGLDTTRIYLTAIRSKPTEPFIRVAAGVENRLAIEAVVNVLVESISQFSP